MQKGTLIWTTNRALSWAASAGLILSLAAVPSSAGAEDAPAPEALTVYTERVPTGFINWGEGYAEIVVQAPYETERYGSSHAKIRAIEEAGTRADEAFYRLLRGINVSGDTRLAGNTALEEALKKVSRRERKMTKQKTANVTLTATFKVPLYGKKGLAGEVYKAAWEAPEIGRFISAAPGALGRLTAPPTVDRCPML